MKVLQRHEIVFLLVTVQKDGNRRVIDQGNWEDGQVTAPITHSNFYCNFEN